jgi:uncharacterized membrane protein YedE/YeeE
MTLLPPLVIGIAFGVALERAGLGNARKLTGQFYLTDLTVFKVMFTAILTAMLGLFWLSRLGWLDLDAVAMPETYLRPQIAGGLLFGSGFALAGLCPGTSCVAAASGRGDGLAVVAGMFTGVLASGFAFPLFLDFYDSDARGAWTLPSLLHVSYGIVVLAVVLVALAGFAAAGRLRTSDSPPARMAVALAALALVLAAGAAVVGTPAPPAGRVAPHTVFKPANGC